MLIDNQVLYLFFTIWGMGIPGSNWKNCLKKTILLKYC
jgi:hypothetical protein